METNWLKIKHFIIHNLPKNHVCHVHTDHQDTDIFIMEKSGKSFHKLTWNTQDNHITLSYLSVSDKRKGLGTYLMKEHLKMCNLFNLESRLLVKDSEWKTEWFEKLGYKLYQVITGDVWMNYKNR